MKDWRLARAPKRSASGYDASQVIPILPESTITKKVLLYLRNSSDTLRTACADSQRYYAESFIRKGWELELTCYDEDIGDVVFTAQPGVHKIFEEVEVGSIDVVLCHTLDRLCSRLAVAERLLHDLEAKGIEVWAADPVVRTNVTAYRLLLLLLLLQQP